QPGTLIVKKHVVAGSGGTKTASDFTLNVTGTNVLPSASFSGSESGTTVTLNAGSYTVDENAVSGYVKTFGADCSGTIANGETKTCTITNSPQQAYVIVEKVVNKTHGGTANPDDFKLTLDGTATTSGTKLAVNPGAHTAAETQLSGYTFDGFSGDCDATGKVTVALGETKTCTLTNSDQQTYV